MNKLINLHKNLVFSNALYNVVLASIGFSFPFTYFLFNSSDFLGDLFKTMDVLGILKTWDGPNHLLFHTNEQPNLNGNPILNVAFYASFASLLKVLSINKYLLFTFFYVISPLITLYTLYSKNLINSFHWILYSYPLLFALQRGNMAIFCFLSLLIFISIYEWRPKIAIIFLSVAICIKITPIIYLPIIIMKEKFNVKKFIPPILSSIAICLLINTISFLLVENLKDPNVITPGIISNDFSLYKRIYIEGNEGLNFGNSFFLLFCLVYKMVGINYDTLRYISYASISLLVFAPSSILILNLLKRNYTDQLLKSTNGLDMSDIFLLFTCLQFIISPLMADYYLLLFLIPLLISRELNLSAINILITILIAPKHYFFIYMPDSSTISFLKGISFQSFINPFLIYVVFLLTLRKIYIQSSSSLTLIPNA